MWSLSVRVTGHYWSWGCHCIGQKTCGEDDINIFQNFLSPCGGEREREYYVLDRLNRRKLQYASFYYLFRPQFHMLFKNSQSRWSELVLLDFCFSRTTNQIGLITKSTKIAKVDSYCLSSYSQSLSSFVM